TGIKGALVDGNTTLSGNTVWNNPAIFYQLNGSVTVASGASLQVDAGQTVKLTSNANLVVDGTLTAPGTAAQNVTFTSYNDNKFAGATAPGTPQHWGALQFNAGSSASNLNDAVVKYGGCSGGGLSGEVIVNTPNTFNNSALSKSGGGAGM